MSLSSKLNAWINSPKGQARLQGKLAEYNKSGVKETAAGSSTVPEERIRKAAEKFIEILQLTAKSYDLPESVMQHIDGMSAGDIQQTANGYEVPLRFQGELHRDSLENNLGYEGIDNIVALFNNGYHAQNYVYGWWHGHSAANEDVTMRSGADNTSVWIRSRREREALKFIQQAIRDFNENFGAEYNITAVIPADIYEQ